MLPDARGGGVESCLGRGGDVVGACGHAEMAISGQSALQNCVVCDHPLLAMAALEAKGNRLREACSGSHTT